jgi:hypothetical protein
VAEGRPIVKYGRKWTDKSGNPIPDLRIELEAFRLGITQKEGGLGKSRHFRNCVSAIWTDFEWHPWAQLQAQALCKHNAVGFAGCMNSGKSEMGAIWILVNWFADPINTLCIVASTSAKDAKGRIWAAILRRYREAQRRGIAPGKIVESASIIKLTEEDAVFSDKGISENSAIVLIAAGDEYKDDAQKRLQGRKNERIFTFFDEVQDCAESLIKEAIYSLPRPHVTLAGNPASIWDAMGIGCTPVGGWMSVDADTPHWKIRVASIDGICIRFDGEDSPNNEEWNSSKKIRWKYLPHPKEVSEARADLGELSPQYWRKYRGMWPPADVDDSHIFTEILINKHQGQEKAYYQDGTVTDILGVDPSYTEGGDRFAVAHMQWGKLDTGLWAINLAQLYTLNRSPDGDADYQYEMISQLIRLKDKLNVKNENIGVDASAGGIFWSIGERGGLKGWLGIAFHGAATERPVSAQHEMKNEDGSPKLAKDIFANRTSELSFVSRYFLESGQLRGLTPDICKEMTERKFVTKNRKILVESKKDMKKRIGRSPDLYDCFSIGVDVIRERFGSIAGGEAIAQKESDEIKAWSRLKESLTLSNNWFSN